MDSTQSYRALFENWPESIERNGIVISKKGETVPFVNFMLAPGLLLLERSGPDASGARKVIIAYEEMAIVKITSPAPLPDFEPLGFVPKVPKRRPIPKKPPA